MTLFLDECSVALTPSKGEWMLVQQGEAPLPQEDANGGTMVFTCHVQLHSRTSLPQDEFCEI